MNELASLVGNYFADNISELKSLGISFSHLRYSSRSSIASNSDKLHEDLLVIYAKVFFACVQSFSTPLFGVPLPLPTPQGRRARQPRTMPEIPVLRAAALRNWRRLRQTCSSRSARDSARADDQATSTTESSGGDCPLPAVKSRREVGRKAIFPGG